MAIEIGTQLSIARAPQAPTEVARLADLSERVALPRAIPDADLLIAGPDSPYAEHADVALGASPRVRQIIGNLGRASSITYEFSGNDVEAINFHYDEFDGDLSEFDHALLFLVGRYPNSAGTAMVDFHPAHMYEIAVSEAGGTLTLRVEISIANINPANFWFNVRSESVLYLDKTAEINSAVTAKIAANLGPLLPTQTVWISGTVNINVKPGDQLRLMRRLQGMTVNYEIAENDTIDFNCIGAGGNYYTHKVADLTLAMTFITDLQFKCTPSNYWGQDSSFGFFQQYNARYTFTSVNWLPSAELVFGSANYEGLLYIDRSRFNGQIYCRQLQSVVNCRGMSLECYVQDASATLWGQITTSASYNTEVHLYLYNYNSNQNLILNVTGCVRGGYYLYNNGSNNNSHLNARNCDQVGFEADNSYWTLNNCFCPDFHGYLYDYTDSAAVYTLINSTVNSIYLYGGALKTFNSFLLGVLVRENESPLSDLSGLTRVLGLHAQQNNLLSRITRVAAGSSATHIIVRDNLAFQLVAPGITGLVIIGHNTPLDPIPILEIVNTTTIRVANLGFTPEVGRRLLICNPPSTVEAGTTLRAKLLDIYSDNNVKSLKLYVTPQGAQFEYSE